MKILCASILDAIASPQQPSPISNLLPPQPLLPVHSPPPRCGVRAATCSSVALQHSAQHHYDLLLQSGTITVWPLHTFQGKHDSRGINGCCVIGSLVVARHLATSIGNVLPDPQICDIIDTECGPLLQQIRGNLNLPAGSLITPSAAIDHLLSLGILKQEYFLGAAGGNIHSHSHLRNFLNMFLPKQRAGGIFFFHGHVVAIIKLPSTTGVTYDFIDSMPTDVAGIPCATQTRCYSPTALDVLLNRYAAQKFSPDNWAYINNNAWVEDLPELDPRVFQGFVWGF